MSTEPANVDADVAVLIERQRTTNEMFREMSKTMADGLASVNAKLERVTEIAMNLSQVQVHQQQHGEGLARAFAAIKELENTIQTQHTDTLAWRGRHDETHQKIEKRLNRATGALLAFAGIGTFVISVFVWAINPWFAQIKDNTDDTHQLERRIDRIESRTDRALP